MQQRVMQKMQALVRDDAQLASLIPLPSVRESICAPGQSLAEIMDRAFDGYADRPAMGTREHVVATTEDGRTERIYQPSFKTITYKQLQSRIHAVANAWKNDPVHGIKADEYVCIFGFTSAEFAILDFATAYVHAVTVPLQPGAANMDFEEILDAIRPVTVCAATSDLETVAGLVAGKSYVKSLIVFEYDERIDTERERFEAAAAFLEQGGTDIALISLEQLEVLGGTSRWSYPAMHGEGGERVASIVHSSGSTGTPKAAMITEKAVRFFWTSVPEGAPPVITVCLAPFSHLLGKGTLVTALRVGGTAYFTLAPDMSTLFDDIRAARPTLLGLFPRVIELVHQHYQNEVAQEIRKTGDDEGVVRARVKRAMAVDYLGSRLCFTLSGGSRISPVVREFFEDCFQVQLLDSYGSTEGGSAAVNGIIQRPPVLAYKLRDVPELGYFTSDRPHPRGEFCYKSEQSIKGYLNAPELTEAMFDGEGFICTGDIVEEYGPDHIAVIDRRNDVLKLSQGEFVPIGALEALFETRSDLFDQVYIYGNSQRSYLLAVIVPDMALASAQIGDAPDDQALHDLIQKEMQRVASQEGVRSFEVPRQFLLEQEPFSDTNGLLSSLRKKIRPALARKYGARLEGMYDEAERVKDERRRELADTHSALSVADKLGMLLELDLGITITATSDSATFYELGGDSLGAVLFSLSVEEIFGVDIPADRILSPTGNIRTWSAYIQRAYAAGFKQPTATSVHGKGCTSITSSELTLAKFIDADTLNAGLRLPASTQKTRTVLLTGANGFLGRFVCLQWLEKLAPSGGKLICLVRATDDDAAAARLDGVFRGLDPEMEARFEELAQDHLEVLAGDVGEPRLGLNEKDYGRLSMEVDRVVHVAALVNHRLSYANLFGPNVCGTAEIIRFSMAGRKKNIDFVSTAAVRPLVDQSGGDCEDAPLLDEIELSDEYAAGYAASKWAAEHLLQQAHREFGIPVNVFRGDMMLPHRIYRGQLNTDDMFSRLLMSIVNTGLAPYSFYPLTEEGRKAVAHYDGLPVDIVSAAIAGAEHDRNACLICNIENYHKGDGCSLDSFVDWIEEAGHAIARVEDYDAWVESFKGALGQLPEDRQQHSALDIMDAFAAPQSAGYDDVAACDRFKALVSNLAVGPEIPHLSRDYIEKCLEDLQLLGLIDPAGKRALGVRK
ncbi:thioester reductase domain-containing protein [Croceicoccus estronivorus]|uniref:thioester reductase domain-containing protein n=1 Tax=Croceicoccus estronivorus TaxID=1172626 RepID=UPI000B01C234|nr:thioester reductase domain-containing protein [Croceicoccus estronivorus]